MEKKKKRRIKLSIRLMVGLLLTAIAIDFAITLCVAKIYRAEMEDQYRQLGVYVTEFIANSVDGDKVESYYNGAPKDKYYDDVKAYIDRMIYSFNLKYFYIMHPEEDGFVYIFDAENKDNPATCELGYKEAYVGDSKEFTMDLWNGGEANFLVTNESMSGYVASVASVVYNSKNEPVAIVCCDIDMEEINGEIARMLEIADVVAILITFISLFLYFVYVRLIVVKPIGTLSKEAKAFPESADENGKLHVTEERYDAGDEIGELFTSVVDMESDIIEYMDNLEVITKERERIGAELNVATMIQASSLPSIFPPFPDRHEFDIFATMCPAKEVGGDFYDFFLIDDNHLALVMADVSGKGVGAALFMMISKTLINSYAHSGLSAAGVLHDVNNRLCDNNKAEMFVTVWLGILDITTGNIVCANGGHEYPFIQRAGGKYELLEDKHGFVLGGMEDVKYKEYEIQLNKGDALFIYTDGVAEATNASNELFGTDRALESLNKDPESGMKEALARMREGIDDFVQEAPQFDDITMLGLRYFGPNA